VGLLEALERHQRRGAIHHHHADRHEGQGREEKPSVRLQLARRRDSSSLSFPSSLSCLSVSCLSCLSFSWLSCVSFSCFRVPSRQQSSVESGTGPPASQPGVSCAPSGRLPF